MPTGLAIAIIKTYEPDDSSVVLSGGGSRHGREFLEPVGDIFVAKDADQSSQLYWR